MGTISFRGTTNLGGYNVQGSPISWDRRILKYCWNIVELTSSGLCSSDTQTTWYYHPYSKFSTLDACQLIYIWPCFYGLWIQVNSFLHLKGFGFFSLQIPVSQGFSLLKYYPLSNLTTGHPDHCSSLQGNPSPTVALLLSPQNWLASHSWVNQTIVCPEFEHSTAPRQHWLL